MSRRSLLAAGRVDGQVLPDAASRAASGYALVAVGVLLWGTLGLSGAELTAATGMNPLTISMLRYLVAGVVLTVALLVTGELLRVPRTHAVGVRVALTSIGSAAPATLYLEAIPRIGVATSTVVALGTSPLAVVLATALRRKAFPTRSVLVGITAALVGLVMASLAPTAEPRAGGDSSRDVALGVSLAIACGLGFAAVTLLNRRPLAGLGPAALLTLSTLGGAVLTAAAMPFAGGSGVNLNPSGIGWLLFMALVPTVAGYLLFYGGLSRGLPATTASVLALLEVLSATVLAMIFLGERVRLLSVIGLVLVLVSAHAVRPMRRSSKRDRNIRSL